MVSGASHTRKTTYTGLISAPVILYNQGRYESAIKGFDEVLLLHPDDQNAIFYKGMCFYQLANFNQAATVLSKISKVEGSPFAEEALFYVAKSYVEMEDLEKGTVLFQDLVNKQGFYSKQAALELKKLKK
ncbi:MAG: tetratricopeptide repeat protein [Bacteroidetes bacterium]|nr:tetratricopeptide repeat protein [Bacteroidota bacterium]